MTIIIVSIQHNAQKIDYDLNRDEPLQTIIVNLCQRFNAIGDTSSFCLQLDSTKHYLEDHDLPNTSFPIAAGSLIYLKQKPPFAASNALQALQDPNIAVKKKVIFELKVLLKDEAFAREFLNQNGVAQLATVIFDATGNTLAYALSALQEAMGYGFGWDSLASDFVNKVMTLIDQSNINVCKSALEIMNLLIENPTIGFKTLEAGFIALNSWSPYQNLVALLGSTDLNIQLRTLTLINRMISHTERDEYNNLVDLLDEAGINNILKKNIGSSDSEVKKQMFIYQRNRLKALLQLREIPYQRENKEHEDLLMRFWKAVFPNTILESRVSEQWKLIGFQGTDPATDFRGMGVLGLSNLLYFAEAYPDQFRKIVQVQAERKERDYPVAVAGINITQMLFDVLKISNDTTTFGSPTMVLFDHPKAFEEIYCTSLKVLDNTWDEMNASYMDFPRVIAAVKKLVSDVIASNPASLDQFNRAALWSGPKQPLAQKSAEEEEETAEPEPIKKLKAQIKQEMLDLVKQQKVSFLLQGAWFKVYKPKAKQPPFVYCKLADNQSEFYLGASANADTVPSDLQTVKLSECAEIVTGDKLQCSTNKRKYLHKMRKLQLFLFQYSQKIPIKRLTL